ncbi:hypothetical protein [Mycobacterium sp. THU-M104]|uniref:hypothetical protein n=1 Tax=Mycobacterium sp. THU-M104 TaxID=3410515 RepID=UPI003BA22D14
MDHDHRPPRRAVSAEPAQWLIERVDLFDDLHWPEGRVGGGFEAYARLLHPLDDHPGSWNWAAIARANDRTLHASAQWEKISSPSSPNAQGQRKRGQPPDDPVISELIGWMVGAATNAATALAAGRPIDREQIIGSPPPISAQDRQNWQQTQSGLPQDPSTGELASWALDALCTTLARHTTTPQVCYFAVWEGWGWLHEQSHSTGFMTLPSSVTSYYAPDGLIPEDVHRPEPAPTEWQLDVSGPTFSLPPDRNYYLFEDDIGAAARIGYWVNEDFFIAQSPSFFWPADHAWCVATEIDDDSTFIGGAHELVDQLCASELIEVLQIPPDAPYKDHINI